MSITHSQSAGEDNAANLEEVETSATSGSGEVRELRSQLAALTDLAAASRETQALHRQHQLWTSRRERRPPRPALRVRRPLPRLRRRLSRHHLCRGPRLERLSLPWSRGAEQDRLMERLNEFRMCGTQIFDGEKVDHWIVEKWLMYIEKLFRDTFVKERDRVWLATHHLDGEVYRCWLDIQENPALIWRLSHGRSSGASVCALLPDQRQEEDGAGLAQLAPRRSDCSRVREGVFSASTLRAFRHAGRREQGPHFRARVATVDFPVRAIL
uniref:Uncharacterized protein n=1 Tax=Ananas comosus var. bracteatus TaxID=296719 RepID=A0A6V7QLA3_ANACO|nr:unnamed protein product [Ananas comosus var. bracteatus]